MATPLMHVQREDFAARGLVALRGAIDPGDAAAMAERVWVELAGRGLERGRRETWTVERPSGFQRLGRTGAFDPIGRSRLPEAVDELIGPDWVRPHRWARPLVTLPSGVPVEWTVPASWHMDWYDGAGAARPTALTFFVVLEPLAPRGGGTLIVPGSHRLVGVVAERIGTSRNKPVVRALGRAYPWFRELFDRDRGTPEERRERFLDRDPEVVEGVPVRVVELTGEPGDVFVMRADTLHTIAPNALLAPRLMLVGGLRTTGGDGARSEV